MPAPIVYSADGLAHTVTIQRTRRGHVVTIESRMQRNRSLRRYAVRHHWSNGYLGANPTPENYWNFACAVGRHEIPRRTLKLGPFVA